MGAFWSIHPEDISKPASRRSMKEASSGAASALRKQLKLVPVGFGCPNFLSKIPPTDKELAPQGPFVRYAANSYSYLQ